MSSTGHKNVYKNSRDSGKPFYVAVKRNNKSKCMGFFATIEDALSFRETLPPVTKHKRNPTSQHRPRNQQNGRFVATTEGR